MSWLRVFQSANPAHSGHSGGQEREPRVVPSEKYAARRGSVEDEMRMITARFAHALQRYTSRTYMHCLLIFQEVMPISKTRMNLAPSGRTLLIYDVPDASPTASSHPQFCQH